VIVPRWEWRTFGERFGAAADRLRELAPTRIDDSDELYIVTDRSEASIKVRGGVLDVKRLEQVSDDGLEQWRPVAKAEFPIAATDVAELLAALDVVVPALARDPYELDELVDEVVRPSAELHSVPVHKRRVHYALGGCMAELTDVLTGSRATHTIAVEAEDPALVRTAVEELGLWSLPNVSFPRGLMALVGFGARRYGVVDVGTNSVKFRLAERTADGAWRQLVDRAEVTRLGEGVREAGGLQAVPTERTIAAIAAMADEAGRFGAEAIVAVGTAGLRAAANSAEFVETVQARCGVRVEVISGEEEARLAFLAATSGIERVDGSLIVFETGGGSTQFTFGQGERVEEQFSVPVGAVRITEQFGLDGVVDDTALASALDAIAADLASLDGRPTPAGLVAMGGAVTNLASVKHELATYDPEVVQGSELDVDELDRLIELFRTRSAEERRAIVGLQPKRAEVILAGACIVRTVMGKLGRESLTVSDRGLRHRLLVERFGGIAPDRFIR
jgi:exopolyphosphatase/guanosine-5'-triphosphate,3'-diphosphate pyrophosphatase